MNKIQHNFTKEEMLWSIQDVAKNFRWNKSKKELKWLIWQMQSRLNLLSEILENDEQNKSC